MPCLERSIAFAAFAFTFVCRSSLSVATPVLTFPVNSQLPPIAYVSQPYEFRLSPDTFSILEDNTNENRKISYTLADQPAWLSINGDDNRTLSGTPTTSTDARVGLSEFRLIALDGTGQSSTEVTLMVVEDRDIRVNNGSVLTHLSQEATIRSSAPDSIILKPEETFAFSFVAETLFRGISPVRTLYYAQSAEHSPLPSWLMFDATNLRFSGRTPPLPATTPASQSWGFVLAASNFAGFSEAATYFQVVVVTRVLSFDEPQQAFSVTRGKLLNITSLLDQLTLDGKPAQRGDLTNAVSIDAPEWLDFEESTISYVGIVPEDYQRGTEFMLSVSTEGSNMANISISLVVVNAEDSLNFLGSRNATTGEYFQYTFDFPSDSYNTSKSVLPDLGSLSGWLKFEQANSTVYGRVPYSQSRGLYNISVTFTSDQKHSSVVVLTVNVIEFTKTRSSSSFTAVSTASITTTARTDSENDRQRWLTHQKVLLGLKIGLPLLFVIILTCLAAWWLRRRFRLRKTSSVLDATRQVSDEASINQNDTIEPVHIRRSQEQLGKDAATQPPQIELAWPQDLLQQARSRLSTRVKTSDTSMRGSSWDDLILSSPQRLEGNRTPIAPIVTKKNLGSDMTKGHKPIKASRNQSNRKAYGVDSDTDSKLSSILVYNAANSSNRMSGVGHGAGINRALKSPSSSSSWQDTLGSVHMLGGRASTMILEAFPTPPTQSDIARTSATRRSLQRWSTRQTLRLVRENSTEEDSFEEARQRYYTDRARDRLEGTSRFASNPVSSSRTRNATSITGKATPKPRGGDEQRQYPVKISTLKLPHASVGWDSGEYAVGQVLVSRDISMASSRQFDSALSSDSQWEDEELIADESVTGDRYWQTATSSNNTKPSPRLPFEPVQSVETQHGSQQGSKNRHAKSPERARLVDQRRRTSIQETDLQQSQRSLQGSFRFI